MNGDKDTVKSNSTSRSYTLEKYQMLRYEVSLPSSIVLDSGTAEVFGTELVCGVELLLSPGQRGTLITFHGCRVSVNGQGIVTFLLSAAEDQEIAHVYTNIHASLEVLRQKAASEQGRGPRVLVCGHESVGKSTLCRTLTSYAARRKHKPILVDVNVGLNQVCFPTTISAVAVSKPYDLMEGWGLEEDPLVFCFGHINPSSNLNLFREQVNRLAEYVNIRSENDSKIFNSGCIINMNGFRKDDSDGGESKEKGIQAIRATAAAFEAFLYSPRGLSVQTCAFPDQPTKECNCPMNTHFSLQSNDCSQSFSHVYQPTLTPKVDTVLVIEDGFLTTFLREDLPPEVNIIRLPKSSGVVTRSADQWTRERDARLHAYLHGENPFRRLHPHQLILKTSDFLIYKVGSEAIPDALLPHGAQESAVESGEESWRSPVAVPFGRDLKHRVIAVSQAMEDRQVPEAPVYGFLVVISVSEDKSTFTVLSPCVHEPPNNLLLLTTMCYVDAGWM